MIISLLSLVSGPKDVPNGYFSARSGDWKLNPLSRLSNKELHLQLHKKKEKFKMAQ